MKRRLIFLMGVLLPAMLAVAVDTTEKAEKQLRPDRTMERAAKDLASNFPQMHLSRVPCDERVATNAVKLFLDMLDYEHCYFLGSDIEKFKAEGAKLSGELAEGHVDFAFRVFTTFMDRVSNRVDYVNQLVKKDFDFTVDESYQWKRKDAPWPKDEQEANEVWRKRIKNQLEARKISDALGTNKTTAAADAEGVEKANEPPVHSETVDAKLSPTESIRKGYARFYSVLKDNDAQWVTERYLNAFTLAYDPHSSFMFPEAAEDFEISMNLSLCGIGALLSPEDGAAKIERIIPGGPADRDGKLKPGDKIVAVGQGDEPLTDILHLPLNRAVKMIRGKKDTKVVLKYIPASDASGSTFKTLTLTRDEVKLEESAAKGEAREILTKDGGKYTLGVITLPEFYANMSQNKGRETAPRYCSEDVAKILETLKKQDVEGLVLDLRSNGGGSLTEAIKVAGLFMPTGPVVQVKDQRRVQQLTDDDPTVAYDGPLIVLVNRFSASASEIVAAALQDYGRAVVIGDSKTHGKGTVQSLTSLSPLRPSLGSVKVTTASFYRIAGGSTQMKGVVPDIIIPSTLEALEVGEEYLPNALPYSTVGPAEYQRDSHTETIMPMLRKKSEERRAHDPKFSAMADLLQQLKHQQQSKEITLNFAERLKLAKSDQDLQKRLEETDPGKAKNLPASPAPNAKENEKDKDAKKKANDIVLNESLNVLADWINANETKAAVTDAKPQAIN